jgi:hypothetical protein
MTLPAYIPYGGDPALTGPVVSDDVYFYTFVLKAQRAKLQAVLDKYFHAPSGGALKYIAFTDYLALMFIPIGHALTNTQERGWVAYTDCFFSLPAIRLEHGIPTALVLHTPYIFVDNVLPFITGREVYGFPKTSATITVPTDPEHVDLLAVDSMGVTTLGPDSQNTQQRLFEIKRAANRHDQRKTWASQSEAVKDIEKLLFPRDSFSGIADDIIEAIILIIQALLGKDALASNFVNLRQFRDIENQDRACYQAIVENWMSLTRWYSGGLLGLEGSYTFDLCDVPSSPIGADLGLASQDVLAGFWIHANVEIGAGKVLWKAGA